MGADRDVPTDVFLSIPEKDFVDALSDLEVGGGAVSSIGRARLIVQLRALFVACGRVVPGLGTVPAAPAAASTALALTPAATSLDRAKTQG